MRNNEKKNKNMTVDDRIEIQGCFSKGMTFKAIVERIGKIGGKVIMTIYFVNGNFIIDLLLEKNFKMPLFHFLI